MANSGKNTESPVQIVNKQLLQQIAVLEKENERLLDMKNTICFLYSVYKQKMEDLEKNYPKLTRSADWDLNIVKKTQEFESITLFDLKILN